jgi:hypothetical protein
MARPIGTAPSGEQLLERAVLLVLEMRRVGNRRRVSKDDVEVDAEKESIQVSKRLLEAKQLQNILTHDRQIRRYIKSRCLPSYFRPGVSLLPLVSVEIGDMRLQDFATQRALLVDQFVNDYPDLVRGAQARLRGLFDPADYPEPEVVRSAFSFEWKYVTLSVPTTLAAIDREIFARERAKTARQWDEAASKIQTLLRTHLAELVKNMTDRLEPGLDGQPRMFRNSLVTNLSEFLRNFDARNITDDRELAVMVERARELLDGVDPITLRRSENLRESVREGFSGLQQSLDRMVTTRPARRIVLNRATPNGAAPNRTAQNGTLQPAETSGGTEPATGSEEINT